MKLELSKCDLCGKTKPSSEVSGVHYCGSIDIGKGIKGTIEIHFNKPYLCMHEEHEEDMELCFECRMKIDNQLKTKTYKLLG